MTISKLIEELQKLSPDAVIIMASDGEGNSFSPLSEIMPDVLYKAENTWSGEIFDPNVSADDQGMDEKEWKQTKKKAKPAVIFYPVN